MNVLIACEESQRVCAAFLKRGHNAFSCDILPPSGGMPDRHIQGDVIPLIDGCCDFETMNGDKYKILTPWDLIIAHPPCTYLTVSGNAWFNVEKYGQKAIERAIYRQRGAEFFMKFINADCPRIAVENPIGYMNTHYRKPDQIIHPYYFGDPVKKATCLWLKGLQPLKYTNIVEPEIRRCKTGKAYSGAAFYATDENGKALRYSDPRTARERSKTFPGIALAMAEQWG